MGLMVGKVSWILKSVYEDINYDSESHQLNYRPYSNYWPYLWRCWIFLLEEHQLREARRCGFDKNASQRPVQDQDTSRFSSRGTGSGKVIEVVDQGVYDEFEGAGEVRGNCIGQKEGVGHRAQRRWPRSTYRPGSPSLSDSTACEVIVHCQDWDHSYYDCVL